MIEATATEPLIYYMQHEDNVSLCAIYQNEYIVLFYKNFKLKFNKKREYIVDIVQFANKMFVDLGRMKKKSIKIN